MLSPKCELEVHELRTAALQKSAGSASERAQAIMLKEQADWLERRGLSSDEIRANRTNALLDQTTLEAYGHAKSLSECRKVVDRYFAGKAGEEELRATSFLSGSEAISLTTPIQGGTFVDFDPDLLKVSRDAYRQTDPVMSDIVDFKVSGPRFRPAQIAGTDRSTIVGSLVAETAQMNPQVIPVSLGAVLRNNLCFVATFSASWEAEIDLEHWSETIVNCSATALGRVIGQHVIAGVGGATDIPGVCKNLPTLATNNTAGKLILGDFLTAFFGVDVFWRNSPKCAWLLSDNVFKMVKAAVDNNGRPLLSLDATGRETILGKPVYISPSCAYSVSGVGGAAGGALIFGDLGSGIVVRCSRMQIQRSINSAQSGADFGMSIYTARQFADAVLWDPSSNANPSVIMLAVS